MTVDGDNMAMQREDMAQGDVATAPRDDAAEGDMTQADTTQATMAQDDMTELFQGDDAASFRSRWEQVQSRFVDDPRGAVEEADALVTDVTESLTSRFADEKASLEQQWARGDDVETEDLRNTLRRYRALFERLLAA